MTNNTPLPTLQLPWELGLLQASAVRPHFVVYEPLFRAGSPPPWRHSRMLRATRWLNGSAVLHFAHAPSAADLPVHVLTLQLKVPIPRGSNCELQLELAPAWKLYAALHLGEHLVAQNSLSLDDTPTPPLSQVPTTFATDALLMSLAGPMPAADLLPVLLSRLISQLPDTLVAFHTLTLEQQHTVLDRSLADPQLGLAMAEQWTLCVEQLPDTFRPQVLLQLHQRATERADYWRQLAERSVNGLADAALALVAVHDLQAQATEYRRLLARTEGDTRRLDSLKREVTHYRELVDEAKNLRRAEELAEEQARLQKELEQLEGLRRTAIAEVKRLREQCEQLQHQVDTQLRADQNRLEKRVEELKIQAEELPSLLSGLTRSDNPAEQGLIDRIVALRVDILEEGMNLRIEKVYSELRALLSQRSHSSVKGQQS